MAFASLFVPNFRIQAVLRTEPELREHAFVLVDENSPLGEVIALNDHAAKAGLECGMTKTNAAQFPGIQIRKRSFSLERTAHATLRDIGWSVSPRMEDVSEDNMVLDLHGLSRLFPSNEDAGKRLLQHSAQCGLFPNVSVGANIETALIAARGFSDLTVIPPGKESECLSCLPVSVLYPSAEIAETLDRWGITTCGALGKLPILQLSERLGQEGVRLHEMARGAGSRSLVIAEKEHSFKEEMELDDPVQELDRLSFLLGRLLDELCTRLTARSLAAAALVVHFDLEISFDKAADYLRGTLRQKRMPSVYETTLEFPVPIRDSKLLLKLLRLRLQSAPPAAPIKTIVLSAKAARPRAAQTGLYVPRFPELDKLELTIARLANVVGPENAGAPSLADTHRPEGFQMKRILLPVHGAETDQDLPCLGLQKGSAANSIGFRVFRPPIPVELDVLAGRPNHVIFQGMKGNVVAVSGPWRTSGNWWREDMWHQDEWDLEIDFYALETRFDSPANLPLHRGLYRVYYDALRQNWFVRGGYD